MSARKSVAPEAADPTPVELDRTLGGVGVQPRGTSGLVRLLTGVRVSHGSDVCGLVREFRQRLPWLLHVD